MDPSGLFAIITLDFPCSPDPVYLNIQHSPSQTNKLGAQYMADIQAAFHEALPLSVFKPMGSDRGPWESHPPQNSSREV